MINNAAVGDARSGPKWMAGCTGSTRGLAVVRYAEKTNQDSRSRCKENPFNKGNFRLEIIRGQMVCWEDVEKKLVQGM